MILSELVGKLGFQTDDAPLKKAEALLEGIKNRLTLIAGTEVISKLAEMSNKLFEMAEKFADSGRELLVMSENLGITVENIQELGFAAQTSGVSAEEMGHSLAHLARHIYDAKTGSKEAQEAFQKAGFSLDQVAGLHSAEDALGLLADKLKDIQDPLKRMGVAQALLGRAGFQMISFLSKGSLAMHQQGEEAKRLGLTLSTGQVNALNKAALAFQKLHAVITAIGGQIASYIGPVFARMIDQLLAFYSVNKELIGQGINKWLDTVAYGLGFISGILTGLVHTVEELHDKFKGAFDFKSFFDENGSFDFSKLKKALTPLSDYLLDSLSNGLDRFILYLTDTLSNIDFDALEDSMRETTEGFINALGEAGTGAAGGAPETTAGRIGEVMGKAFIATLVATSAMEAVGKAIFLGFIDAAAAWFLGTPESTGPGGEKVPGKEGTAAGNFTQKAFAEGLAAPAGGGSLSGIAIDALVALAKQHLSEQLDFVRSTFQTPALATTPAAAAAGTYSYSGGAVAAATPPAPPINLNINVDARGKEGDTRKVVVTHSDEKSRKTYQDIKTTATVKH